MEKVKTWWCCSFRWNGKVQYFCFHWLPIRLMVVFLYRKVDGCSSCKYLLAPQHLHSNGLACHSLVNFGRLTASFEFGWYSVSNWLVFSTGPGPVLFTHQVLDPCIASTRMHMWCTSGKATLQFAVIISTNIISIKLPQELDEIDLNRQTAHCTHNFNKCYINKIAPGTR